MGTIEKGLSQLKPIKKQPWKDVGNLVVNQLASPWEGLTGNNFYNPEMTTSFGNNLEGMQDKFGKVSAQAGITGLNMIAPGAGTALQATGQGVGAMLPEPEVNLIDTTKIAKYGGKMYRYSDKKQFALGGEKPLPTSKANSLSIVKKKVPILDQYNQPRPDKFQFINDTIPQYNKFMRGDSLYTPPPIPVYPNGKLDYRNIDPIVNPIEYGNNTLSQYSKPMTYKDGGDMLHQYSGSTHENGGIPLGQNAEVQDKETSFNKDEQTDFIFSNDIMFPDSKLSFAQKSKGIANKYKIRPNDAWAKNSQKRELEKLADLQESIKQRDGIGNETNEFVFGGINPRMMKGINDYLGSDLSIGVPNTTYGMFNSDIAPMASKGIGSTLDNSKAVFNKSSNSFKAGDITGNGITPQTNGTAYQSNPNAMLAGYGIQALSNLPGLLAKPGKVKYDRITPEQIDLSSQRDESRRNRNLAYAVAQRQAGTMGNSGQAGAYINATTSAVNDAYGNAYNNSFMQQANTNAQLRGTAKAQNAEIQMRESDAQMQENDAARSMRNQAISNIGSIAAMSGKGITDLQQKDAEMTAMFMSDPNYYYEWMRKKGLNLKQPVGTMKARNRGTV